jgi:hypothetical protein
VVREQSEMIYKSAAFSFLRCCLGPYVHIPPALCTFFSSSFIIDNFLSIRPDVYGHLFYSTIFPPRRDDYPEKLLRLFCFFCFFFFFIHPLPTDVRRSYFSFHFFWFLIRRLFFLLRAAVFLLLGIRPIVCIHFIFICGKGFVAVLKIERP